MVCAAGLFGGFERQQRSPMVVGENDFEILRC